MQKLTAEDVALMSVTERLDAMAKLSPDMGRLIREGREQSMADLQIFEHFRIARDMKPN